ncbi:gamma-glutamyltransferase family protein [Bradyrhizobium prioriisuperbiae]|uniref:gamma-glutamyltransferase family protein n=1 Tax=Bradyrhizobium prioriisuperbiae TaxID=2854389 RepID=UPI0028ECB648|nr:gamma-glutamyltransferase family protein [Bradyrhizobium prioritasuperba]
MRDFHHPGRSAVFGTEAMIATSHPTASFVGLELMRRGGSAVDAAIGACAVLCAVEPGQTGIGGDCFAIIAEKGQPIRSLNGSGRAPAAASREALTDRGFTAIADDSPFAVTVPGAVDAWCRLHRDYGKLPLQEVLEPAATIAEHGYVIAPRVAFDIKAQSARLARHAGAAALFLPDGEPLKAGDRHAQPRLAATLRKIGKHGRGAFYDGEVADEIVSLLQSHGGPHVIDDFHIQRSEYIAPLRMPYRGYELLECAPNGQGAIAMLILAALGRMSEWQQARHSDAARARMFVQASRAAYYLRDRFLADPHAMKLPPDSFFRAPDMIDFVREHALAGGPMRLDFHRPQSETDTICLSAVDRDGLSVSFINSLFTPFGATLLTPRSGIMLHCRGSSFTLEAGHANVLAGGKRPMHTIIPGMLATGDDAVMPFGVMGGQYQAAGHANLLIQILEMGMDVQAAIDAPRLFGYDKVQVERGISQGIIEHLERASHSIERVHIPIGGAQLVWIDREKGTLIGASDPRKDGCALGY